jgi:hypothetical protein
MIIAVVAMSMVQVPIYEEIDMIAMRHLLVAAVRAVPVRLVVAAAAVAWRAGGRVLRRFRNRVLVHVVAVHVVQVTLVQVIDVAFVLDRGVAAVLPVDVVMWLVNLALAHD